jgi:DNA invertase Pin-like site-specific DNA recombinase
LDTTTPAGKTMFQMMGVFAEFERSMIQERVRAGLARAKSTGTRSGKLIGRPKIAPDKEKRILAALKGQGSAGCAGDRQAARVAINTVQRIAGADG